MTLPTRPNLCPPSRHNLYHAHDIHHFSVPLLDRAQALALVRFEATIRNLPATAAATDNELAPIYACVGGNPLALRLVVGQLHVHALPTILHNLAAVNSRKVESLYTFISPRLGQSGRAGAPLAAGHAAHRRPRRPDTGFPGCGRHHADGDLRNTLDMLVMLNLVDTRGELHHRLYTIHSLTRTFLQEQVAKWQPFPLS